ncbi:MAG: FAD-binding oxidoreductase, partial [Flavobacteriaceae bacterium]|nr:FAD-binding oxidoreductase [Flavobacteriaceae bacterium]
MSQFHALVVSDVRRETAMSVSINFHVPENLKEYYSFTAGQYITLKTNIDGEEVRRDYSICSSPSSGELRVAVKEVPEGLFSVYMNRNLKEGDIIDVSKPNGRFTFNPEPENSRHIVSFVAGSGITPVLSILKTLLLEEPNSKISILYGNKSVADTMFYEELISLKDNHPNRFNLAFTFSQNKEDDAMFGRIDNANANYFLKNIAFDSKVDAFYLCGPEEMIYGISDLLKSKGVDESKIKFELFTVKLEDEKE